MPKKARKKDQLRCGECGGGHFALTHVAPLDACRLGGGGILEGHIEAVCLKCKEVSTIKVQASLDVEGSLCGGWS